MTTTESYNLVGAAERIGVGPTTIRYWILSGRLKAAQVKIDGEKKPWRWMISEADLLAADKEAKANPRGGKRGRRGYLVRDESDEALLPA